MEHVIIKYPGSCAVLIDGEESGTTNIRVLRTVRKKENGPFLIHCQHGADRTGVMSAIYRIVVQGWSKEEAVKEMLEGGYGFHPVWSNIIQYVKNVDVDKIKREVAK